MKELENVKKAAATVLKRHSKLSHCWEDKCTCSALYNPMQLWRGVWWSRTRQTSTVDLRVPRVIQAPVAVPVIIQIWSPWLRFTRWVGITPLQVVNEPPYIKFKCTDLGCLRTFILLLLYVFCFSVSLITVIGSLFDTPAVVVDNFISVLYFGHCIFTCYILLRRGRDLATMFEKWVSTEQQMSKFSISEGLNNKCRILCIGVCIASLVDNLLYLLSKFLDENGDWLPIREALTNVADQSIVTYFGNHTYLYGVAEIFTEVWAEMTWILADLWVMLCALILRHYHGRFNELLEQKTTHEIPSHAIEELRQSFTVLSSLSNDINQVLQPFLVLAVGTNLIYFLGATYTGLVQELTHPDIMQRVTSTTICLFLLLRLQGTCILASLIPEEIVRTREILLTWPSLFSAEEHPEDGQDRLIALERFILQTTSQTGELRGYGFFALTKGFFVTLVSAIVTYEVIMLQLPRRKA